MSNFHTKKQHCDLLNMHSMFLAHLDLARLEQDLNKRTFNPASPNFSIRNQMIGTGSFCNAYKILLSQESKPFEYALSVPHGLYAPLSKHLQHCRNWVKSMKNLEIQSRKQVANGEPIPLIPPFMLIKTQGPPVLLSVYGPQSISESAEHWTPIEAVIEKFESSLMALQMRIEDQLQMKSSNGVPFVHDFSDLVVIK